MAFMDLSPCVTDTRSHWQEAMDKLVDTLGPEFSQVASDVHDLWAEYEAASTPEALFVKDLDKFEMIVQALEYEKSALRHALACSAAADSRCRRGPATAVVLRVDRGQVHASHRAALGGAAL